MAASFVTSSLHLGHIATAMLPLCNNELTERCYHFGLTFVIKQPLICACAKIAKYLEINVIKRCLFFVYMDIFVIISLKIIFATVFNQYFYEANSIYSFSIGDCHIIDGSASDGNARPQG